MTDEIRTRSATGGEKGVKAERYDLLPKEGLDAMARVYAFGATKYSDHNWRFGYEWYKSIASALRHMMAFQDGETNDPESGLPHPAHAMFHMAALLTWLEEQGEGAQNPMDDRWRAGMERVRAGREQILASEFKSHEEVVTDALTVWGVAEPVGPKNEAEAEFIQELAKIVLPEAPF